MCIVYMIEADQERLRNFEIGPGARIFFSPDQIQNFSESDVFFFSLVSLNGRISWFRCPRGAFRVPELHSH